ncbi:MAG: alpha-glucan family phosphorylase [Candidatus Aenigmatarchaeota archaeon]
MKRVAYFCMEYGLHPDLRIHAGGLGILAGDILKAAKEKELNLVGVGALWTKGYAVQEIKDGEQVEHFPKQNYDPLEEMDISFSKYVNGEKVKFKVYKTEKFGNEPLYLLDTDLPENSESGKQLTEKLYIGSGKKYLLQQLALGKAGLELVRRINFEPDFYHLNESDAVFVGLELLKERKGDINFKEALRETKERVRFTTHTPVEAGNPKYSYEVMKDVGLLEDFSVVELKRIGEKPFNLTLAGLRISGRANGVSEKHKHVARKMWSLHRRTADIVGITNGVHLGTWLSKGIKKAKDPEELWEAHKEEKEKLLEKVDSDPDPETPLIGFARRFVDYKRPDLLFWDEDKVEEVLKKANVVFSGKAHPNDEGGKKLVSRIVEEARKRNSVMFLEDYNMSKAKYMTRGCDIWLSCPRPPEEACSTSVIKAAANGVLNLSTLDGWWAEACKHGKNGWQFGNGVELKDEKKQDKHDAKSLYRVLLNEVIPKYREREKWTKMMENSIATARPEYTASSLVDRYSEKLWS